MYMSDNWIPVLEQTFGPDWRNVCPGEVTALVWWAIATRLGSHASTPTALSPPAAGGGGGGSAPQYGFSPRRSEAAAGTARSAGSTQRPSSQRAQPPPQPRHLAQGDGLKVISVTLKEMGSTLADADSPASAAPTAATGDGASATAGAAPAATSVLPAGPDLMNMLQQGLVARLTVPHDPALFAGAAQDQTAPDPEAGRGGSQATGVSADGATTQKLQQSESESRNRKLPVLDLSRPAASVRSGAGPSAAAQPPSAASKGGTDAAVAGASRSAAVPAFAVQMKLLSAQPQLETSGSGEPTIARYVLDLAVGATAAPGAAAAPAAGAGVAGSANDADASTGGATTYTIQLADGTSLPIQLLPLTPPSDSASPASPAPDSASVAASLDADLSALLTSGLLADVLNRCDAKGRLPLHAAAATGRVEAVERLLALGCDASRKLEQDFLHGGGGTGEPYGGSAETLYDRLLGLYGDDEDDGTEFGESEGSTVPEEEGIAERAAGKLDGAGSAGAGSAPGPVPWDLPGGSGAADYSRSGAGSSRYTGEEEGEQGGERAVGDGGSSGGSFGGGYDGEDEDDDGFAALDELFLDGALPPGIGMEPGVWPWGGAEEDAGPGMNVGRAARVGLQMALDAYGDRMEPEQLQFLAGRSWFAWKGASSCCMRDRSALTFKPAFFCVETEGSLLHRGNRCSSRISSLSTAYFTAGIIVVLLLLPQASMSSRRCGTSWSPAADITRSHQPLDLTSLHLLVLSLRSTAAAQERPSSPPQRAAWAWLL